MGNCHTVGPNEALVVSGGCCGSDYKQYVFGGWAWAWWCISDTQRISLEIMTLQPRCEDVETAEGVALTVTGVAQVKIMTEKELLAVACEQFLGKNVQDIKNVVLQTLEGHLRSILGTLTVEQIYQDRDQFAKLVREVAAPDVGRMGIEILSFTIKDVYDKVDYLSSLGKTQTAVVQRDADIGVAEAERDAGIREAECKKEMLDVKFMADTKIADSKRAFELQKSAFSEEVNIKTAEAQLAYELQGAREQQKIRQEEIEIEVVQRKKQIAVEEQEILRTDKELIATVRRPAEAEAHRIQQIAEGEKVKQVLLAQAEAEKIRKLGEAEAAVIEAMGKAEAERMKLKAEAYQKYGDAAKMALVLEALPQIAAKIAAPLTKVDEIVVLSGDNSKVTSEVNRLLAELPASVHALTGVDLSKVSAWLAAGGAVAAAGPGLMASPIPADTPGQEGHRCAGMRLPEARALQQLSSYHSDNGMLLTLVPYFVGTRSAACPGLLWLSPASPVSGCLLSLPRPPPSLSLPRPSGLSLPPPSPISLYVSSFICLSFSLPLCSHRLHTSCGLSCRRL
uniref:Flotillin n=1 Tax=Ailuropoda melanoleuca TaxID=9646 RepID=G1LD56_AILME